MEASFRRRRGLAIVEDPRPRRDEVKLLIVDPLRSFLLDSVIPTGRLIRHCGSDDDGGAAPTGAVSVSRVRLTEMLLQPHLNARGSSEVRFTFSTVHDAMDEESLSWTAGEGAVSCWSA